MEILGQPRQPLLDFPKAIVEIERQAKLDGDPEGLDLLSYVLGVLMIIGEDRLADTEKHERKGQSKVWGKATQTG